jgi:hypothetical protein
MLLRDEVGGGEGKAERSDVLQHGRKKHQQRQVATIRRAEGPRHDDAGHEQHELPDQPRCERAGDRPAGGNGEARA